MKIRVGVFFGNRSVEHEVSIITAIQAIKVINKEKFEIIPIYIDKKGIWYTGKELLEIKNFKNLDQLLKKCQKVFPSVYSGENVLYSAKPGIFRQKIVAKIDIAFPLMHGTFGEDGAIQGLFEIMDLPYVGCNVLASSIGMDKITQKELFQAAGLPIVDYFWCWANQWLDNQEEIIKKVEEKLCYPIIVKPANIGSSIGIIRCNSKLELIEAANTAINFSDRVIFEKLIVNLREANCSILGDWEKTEVSVLEEPIRAHNILSFEDKYCNQDSLKGMSGLKREIPAKFLESTTKNIQDMAKKVFTLLQCNGVVRIDFLIDTTSNKIFVNEVNTMPGSIAFYLWEPSGVNFTQLMEKLLDLALKRFRERKNIVYSFSSNILAQDSLGKK